MMMMMMMMMIKRTIRLWLLYSVTWQPK